MLKKTKFITSIAIVAVLIAAMPLVAFAATDSSSKADETYIFIGGTLSQPTFYKLSAETRIKYNPSDAHLWTACAQLDNSYFVGTQLYDESEVGATSLKSTFGIYSTLSFTPTKAQCLHAVQVGNGVAKYTETYIDLENA